jgi:hypothetical protein
VSFDDGDHWQSLQLNLPPTSVRDLVVHDSDLVAGTHGRSFWVLDDVTPLRQIAAAAAASGAFLFRPAGAVRVRWNVNTDTPLPIDEPAGRNPPDGAVLDYYLPRAATGPVVLEILDAAGTSVRRFSSDDGPEPADSGVNIPPWWIRPATLPGTEQGMHRFVWDLHGPPPAALRHEYPIAAIEHDTPREPRGPWVPPGGYKVRLTVDGRAQTQPLDVRMDPRVRVAAAALRRQFAVASRLVDALRRDSTALAAVQALSHGPAAAPADDSLEQRLAAAAAGLRRLNGRLVDLYAVVEGADAAPTAAAQAAARDLERGLADLEGRARALGGRFRSASPGLQ